jgi:hypothetical protein
MNRFDILKTIEEKKDDLVEKAKELVEKIKNELPATSQLHNLLRLANSTRSIEEIKNYIKYQIGRGSVSGFGKKENGFGKEILDIIEAIFKELSRDKDKSIVAIRLFLGYLARESYYNEEKESKKL